MNSLSHLSFRLLVLFIFCAFLFDLGYAQDKPPLSEAIRETIDARGVEGTKKHFSEMDQSQRESYNIDTEGISDITTYYLEEGNLEALTAISEIVSVFMQDMILKSTNELDPKMAEMMAEQLFEAEEAGEERNNQPEEMENLLGEPRDDLERFTGLYANPEEGDSTRQLWVQTSCDGYLVSGAMWGDASPWWLRSESENVFTASNSFNSVRMEFKESSGTLEMIHDLVFMASPLQRTGPLPNDWDSCLEPYR